MNERGGIMKNSKQNPKILQDFLIYITVIQGKAKRTRAEYEYDLSLFLRFLTCMSENVDFEQIETIDIKHIDAEFIKGITLEDIYMFLEYCETYRGNGNSSKARKVASIRAYFKYLYKKKKVLTVNPAEELETPKKGKRNPIYLTIDEVDVLKTGIRKTHYLRDYCIVTLFLNCGLRISELCGINTTDINGDVLKVIGKGNKEREVYLNEACLCAIDEYINYEREIRENIADAKALFLSQKGTRLTPRTVQQLIKNLNERSGLGKEKLSPHKLRHTMATLSYQNGADILSLQQILGHSSVATTQIYTQSNSEILRSTAQSNPFNKPIRNSERKKNCV